MFEFEGVEFPLNGPPNGFGTGEGWTVTGDPPTLKSPSGEVVAVADIGEPSVEGVTDPFAGTGGESYAYLFRAGTKSRTILVQTEDGQEGDVVLIVGPPSPGDPLGLADIRVQIDATGQAYFKKPPALWNEAAGKWVTLPIPEPAP